MITLTDAPQGLSDDKPTEDDPLADVHAALLRTIAELRAIGITVPISLHQAMHALTYARARRS